MIHMLLSFPPQGTAGIDLWRRIECALDRAGIPNRKDCSEMSRLLDTGVYLLGHAAQSRRRPHGCA